MGGGRRGASNNEVALQNRYWPTKVCYGCGPANAAGLQLKSFVAEAGAAPIVAEALWTPKTEHVALPGIVNGGVLSTVLDCHSNILAAFAVMRARGGADKLPSMTVTAQLNVKFAKPAPMRPLRVVAAVDHSRLDGVKGKVWVTAFVVPAVATEDESPALLGSRDALLALSQAACATCDGLFVALRESKS